MEIITRNEKILYVGIDVHKDTYSLCCFDFFRNELSDEMTIKATTKAVIKYPEAAVKALSKKYRLFLASNGTAKVQEGRMTSAKLYPYFEQVFISEEIGLNKPAKAYFDACFARIPDFEKGKAMMVGDSLTSDIRGGNNAGLLTCWINPGHAPRNPEIHVDYEIEALSQLEALLSTPLR